MKLLDFNRYITESKLDSSERTAIANLAISKDPDNNILALTLLSQAYPEYFEILYILYKSYFINFNELDFSSFESYIKSKKGPITLATKNIFNLGAKFFSMFKPDISNIHFVDWHTFSFNYEAIILNNIAKQLYTLKDLENSEFRNNLSKIQSHEGGTRNTHTWEGYDFSIDNYENGLDTLAGYLKGTHNIPFELIDFAYYALCEKYPNLISKLLKDCILQKYKYHIPGYKFKAIIRACFDLKLKYMLEGLDINKPNRVANIKGNVKRILDAVFGTFDYGFLTDGYNFKLVSESLDLYSGAPNDSYTFKSPNTIMISNDGKYIMVTHADDSHNIMIN